jgi:hypothetical protein
MRYHDGDTWTDHVQPLTPPPSAPAKSSGKRVLLLVLAIVAVIVIGGIAAGSSDSSGPSGPRSKSTAEITSDFQDVCRDFVKRQLKAPATAKFSSERTTGPALAANGLGEATVTGMVDSENGFSALLRSSYTCVITAELKPDGSTNYHGQTTIDD